AREAADALADIPGLRVVNRVDLNQVVIAPTMAGGAANPQEAVCQLATRLNEDHGVFVKTAYWKGRDVIRLSVISPGNSRDQGTRLAQSVASAWRQVCRVCHDPHANAGK
ncbi:MAG: aspartate aminotransferase family protein, partial [Hyphomicrobiales bacterium]|nr:aspartate aminotransferase family protein [Hyphomicrobiales bacterium]